MLLESWTKQKSKERMVSGPVTILARKDDSDNHSAQEIATLRKEAQAFTAVRRALRQTSGNVDAPKLVFQKAGLLPAAKAHTDSFT